LSSAHKEGAKNETIKIKETNNFHHCSSLQNASFTMLGGYYYFLEPPNLVFTRVWKTYLIHFLNFLEKY
jgi:hypothetical protein